MLNRLVGEYNMPWGSLMWLKNKIAVIDLKNKDNECFKWCIARYFSPKSKNAERIDKNLKIQSEKFNWENVDFPVKDIWIS